MYVYVCRDAQVCHNPNGCTKKKKKRKKKTIKERLVRVKGKEKGHGTIMYAG